jgi:hypothetical protein
MLLRDSESIEHSQASRRAPCFHIEFRAHAPDEFCFATYSGKRSGEKEQVARLHRFRVDAERLRRSGISDLLEADCHRLEADPFNTSYVGLVEKYNDQMQS